MIYGSIRVHMGPYGPIWVARGEKSNVNNVKIIISDSDFFRGLCRGDIPRADPSLTSQLIKFKSMDRKTIITHSK